MKAKRFIDIMEWIAVNHKDINHDPQAKEKHFFRGELEEFYMGLRNKVNFPALIIEGFSLQYDFPDPESGRKNRETSFIVVTDYKHDNDYDQIQETFEKAEEIGDEILRMLIEIVYEQRCPTTIENISGVQVQNEQDRTCGIRYTLTLNSTFIETINKQKWHGNYCCGN